MIRINQIINPRLPLLKEKMLKSNDVHVLVIIHVLPHSHNK